MPMGLDRGPYGEYEAYNEAAFRHFLALERKRADRALGGLDDAAEVHDGQTFYFCGKGCMLDFKEDPAPYFAPDYKPSM